MIEVFLVVGADGMETVVPLEAKWHMNVAIKTGGKPEIPMKHLCQVTHFMFGECSFLSFALIILIKKDLILVISLLSLWEQRGFDILLITKNWYAKITVSEYVIRYSRENIFYDIQKDFTGDGTSINGGGQS